MSQSNATILIIEDSPSVMDIMQFILQDLGYKVVSVPNTAEAKKKLSTEKVSVVLSDVQLPDKSGLEFLREMKDGMGQVPPWIFMTGDANATLLKKAVELGAINLLKKPVDSMTLKAALKKAETQGS